MNVLYLIGAGRSGTTILSLLLGNTEQIRALGELHQLPEHCSGLKVCSCGKPLLYCSQWESLRGELSNRFSGIEYREQAKQLESHRFIIKYFYSPSRANAFPEYLKSNVQLFEGFSDSKWLIDSSKYVGRGLALNTLMNNKLKFVFLVRDPRGVVGSFEKNVQTSRKWYSAAFYYLIVNLTTLVASWTLLRGKVLRLRYEDLLHKTDDTLEQLSNFLQMDLSSIIHKLEINSPLETGHIIGGNRLVNNRTTVFRRLDNWQHKMPHWKRLFVWLITFPICLINGYRP